MKAKRRSPRTHSHEHEVSAGGVIWRRGGADSIEVVLIQPAGRDHWVLPKGHVEENEDTLTAALRECREETGLIVVQDQPLGEVSYVYSRRAKQSGRLITIFKRVYFFIMHSEGGDISRHDDEVAEVRWFGLNEAVELASYEGDRTLIKKAQEILSGGCGQLNSGRE